MLQLLAFSFRTLAIVVRKVCLAPWYPSAEPTAEGVPKTMGKKNT